MSSVADKTSSSNGVARLKLGDRETDLPIIVGTEDERAVDISKLRAQTGFVTLDEGYVNTGAATSGITYLDGEQGILRYRGYPIEMLAEKCDFVEVSYLLIYGELPNREQLDKFRTSLRRHTMLHEDMRSFYNGFPRDAHPMAILGSVVVRPFHLLSGLARRSHSREGADFRLPVDGQAAHDRRLQLQKVDRPAVHLSQQRQGLLRELFADDVRGPQRAVPRDPDSVEALNKLLIVHADHEQNCSTSTVRMVGSSDANLFASISAGICALWGPLHGGANQACVEMLEQIRADGGNVKKYVELAKKKDQGSRLMGFGHRVYKNYDPRAKIIREMCASTAQEDEDPRSNLRHRQGAGGGRAFRSVLHRAEVVSQRGFLFRGGLSSHGHAGADVYGAVRHRPAAGLDRALDGDAPFADEENLPSAASLHWA